MDAGEVSAARGDPKNEIRKAITPDHRDYARYMGGVVPGAAPAQPRSGSGSDKAGGGGENDFGKVGELLSGGWSWLEEARFRRRPAD
jgi:hypothetical protein